MFIFMDIIGLPTYAVLCMMVWNIYLTVPGLFYHTAKVIDYTIIIITNKSIMNTYIN